MAEPGYYVRTLFRYFGGRVGLVDSAREENKAREVAEIYLNRGRYPIWAYTLSIPQTEIVIAASCAFACIIPHLFQ